MTPPAFPFLCACVLFVIHSRSCQCEIITVPFSATVTEAVGAPFGIVAQPGVTTISGSFSYDTSTMPESPSPINNGKFPTMIPSGILLYIGGKTITSSNYAIDAVNNVMNFGGSDIFRALASGTIGDFLVDGNPVNGSVNLTLVDTDQTLYVTNEDAMVPPTVAQLAMVDFRTAFLGDRSAPGGDAANHISFRSIPEPSVALLAAQVLVLLTSTMLRVGDRGR